MNFLAMVNNLYYFHFTEQVTPNNFGSENSPDPLEKLRKFGDKIEKFVHDFVCSGKIPRSLGESSFRRLAFRVSSRRRSKLLRTELFSPKVSTSNSIFLRFFPTNCCKNLNFLNEPIFSVRSSNNKEHNKK